MVLVALLATQTCVPTGAMPLGVLRLLPETGARATGVPPAPGVLVAVAPAPGVLVAVAPAGGVLVAVTVDGTGVLVAVAVACGVVVAVGAGVLVAVAPACGVLVAVGDVVDSCQREMVLLPALITQTWVLPTAASPWG